MGKFNNLIILNLKNSGGQVALVVLLISAIILTFGLSVTRKTAMDTKIDTDQELLKQAFNTAESGVDYYLSTGKVGYTSPDGKSMANVTVNPMGGGNSVGYGEYVAANNNANMWLIGHNDAGAIVPGIVYGGTNIKICVETAFDGALRVDYFYQTSLGQTRVQHYGFNFGAGVVNNFAAANQTTSSCPSGQTGTSINVTAPGMGTVPMLLNIVPISTSGRGTNLTIVGDASQNIPSQGTEINSIGKSGDTSTSMAVSRKVRVFRRYQLPQFMFDGITSGGSVIGN